MVGGRDNFLGHGGFFKQLSMSSVLHHNEVFSVRQVMDSWYYHDAVADPCESAFPLFQNRGGGNFPGMGDF
jgi:hypothetical protein